MDENWSGQQVHRYLTKLSKELKKHDFKFENSTTIKFFHTN